MLDCSISVDASRKYLELQSSWKKARVAQCTWYRLKSPFCSCGLHHSGHICIRNCCWHRDVAPRDVVSQISSGTQPHQEGEPGREEPYKCCCTVQIWSARVIPGIAVFPLPLQTTVFAWKPVVVLTNLKSVIPAETCSCWCNVFGSEKQI